MAKKRGFRHAGWWGAVSVIAAMAVGSGLAFSSVPAKPGGDWVEVCTRHGRVMVKLLSRIEKRSPRDSVEAQGCAWCVPPAVRSAPAEAFADEALARLQRFNETGPFFGWSDGELRVDASAG